jgi:transcriptional regulator GlxA family with amidase domain
MSPKEIDGEELQRIAAVKSYLHNHLDESFHVRQLAKKAALGTVKFGEGFYRMYGQTVGTYIHNTRMETGRFLLLHTDKSVKEIAAICGYSKTRNFSSAYKKFFGMSPSEERMKGR